MFKTQAAQGAGVSLHRLALQHWLSTERQNHGYSVDSDPLFGTFLRAQPKGQSYRYLRAWLAANWDDCELVSAAELSTSLDKEVVMRKLASCGFDEVAATVTRVQNAHRDLASALSAWKELLNGPAEGQVSERETGGGDPQREPEPGLRDPAPARVKVRGVSADKRGTPEGVRS